GDAPRGGPHGNGGGGVSRPGGSFVVTCQNYGGFLAQGLDSLLAQPLPGGEGIVIDDASTDETGAVLGRYLHDHRIRGIAHTSRRGNIASYNEGLDQARGQLVGILSADDYLLRSHALERQAAGGPARPGA